jgi:hypothetical protein
MLDSNSPGDGPARLTLERELGETLAWTANALWTLPVSPERDALAVRLEAFWSVLSSWSWRPPSKKLQRLVAQRLVELSRLVQQTLEESANRMTLPGGFVL